MNYKKRVESRIKEDSMYCYYYNFIESLIMSKWHFENLPDSIKPEYMLKPLIRGGVGGFAKVNDIFFTGIPVLSGISMYSDVSTHANLVNPLGESSVLEIDREIAIGYNNYGHLPELEIDFFATMFTELNRSMKCNVINSRLSYLLEAESTQEKSALESAIGNVYAGRASTVQLSKNTLNDIINSEKTLKDKVVKLTEPKDCENLQYLSKFYDDLQRRLCNFHGLPMSTTGKMAQITKDELQESQFFSHVYTNQQYELLQRYVDDINRIFELEIVIDFSDAWKHFKIENSVSASEFVEEIVKKDGEANADSV